MTNDIDLIKPGVLTETIPAEEGHAVCMERQCDINLQYQSKHAFMWKNK